MRRSLLAWLTELLRNLRIRKSTKGRFVSQLPVVDEKKKPEQEKVLLNVGLDYGTSSTKVVIRDLLKSKSIVLFFDEPWEGLPKFAVPSTVSVQDDNLYFGRRAELASSGRKFRSLKVCLGCQMGLMPCRGCEPERTRYSLPIGSFAIMSKSSTILRVPSESLVVAYVSYIMKRTYEWIEKQYANAQTSVTFNVSAPLDQLNITEAEKLYNHLFYLAEKLARNVDQGVSISQWMVLYDEAKRRFSYLPEQSDRNVFVQPETVAAVMPYTKSVAAEEGLYAIVDVGAGTTDVSFFRLGPFLPRQLSFYFAKTHPVGGDDMDSEIANWVADALRCGGIAELDGGLKRLVDLISISKHRLSSGGGMQLQLNTRSIRVDGSDIQDICIGSLQSIYDTYEQAWLGAYKKEDRMSRWKDYKVVFLGGGSRLENVQRRVLRPPREFIRRTDAVKVLPQDDVMVLPSFQKADIEKDLDFLCVAYGLSFPQVDFNQVRFPRRVDPLEPAPPPLEQPDRDELYPP